MNAIGKLLVCAAFVGLVAISPAQAQDQVEATQSVAPDGTTTTVITTPPAASAAPVVLPETTVVIEKPVAIDALSGQPVESTTPVKEEKPSLRDKVRSKME